jgi:hypothetical protein
VRGGAEQLAAYGVPVEVDGIQTHAYLYGANPTNLRNHFGGGAPARYRSAELLLVTLPESCRVAPGSVLSIPKRGRWVAAETARTAIGEKAAFRTVLAVRQTEG